MRLIFILLVLDLEEFSSDFPSDARENADFLEELKGDVYSIDFLGIS